MSQRNDEILIAGITVDEFLAMPQRDLIALVFTGEPVAFHIGSAEVLGLFAIESTTLVIELAQIDGGGEGVLPAISSLARKIAKRESLAQIEWRVHALNCAKPNPKLTRVMVRRGFQIEDHPKVGQCYVLRESMP